MSSETDCTKADVQLLLDAIQLHFDSSQLKTRLRKCHSSVIREWKDENSFDLLHHCILENNIVALVLFLNEGYFKPPYEPRVWPYLHLIACMGHRGHISIVVQETKFQSDSLYLNWDVFDKIINAKIKENVCPIANSERNKTFTPIDLAGIFKHSSCVELLLDYWHLKKVNMNSRRHKNSSKSLYLSLTCEVNSPYALRLLMKNHDDKKEALESALRMMSPECVDVLLRERSLSDIKKAFNGMNLFHVLFSYSSCQSVQKYEAMAEVTSVLITHGQDVNACCPSRTLPLYSLLNHQMTGVSVGEGSSCLIAILLLLLNSGADPNFDEILVEEKVFKNNEQNAAFGRRPYSSSIMCVLSALASWGNAACDMHMESELAMMEQHIYKCIEILLRHNLDLSFVGTFCDVLPDSDMPSQIYHTGNGLHFLASTRQLNPISYPIMRLMLHYGINADVQGSWGAYNFHYNPLRFASNILLFSVWTSHERYLRRFSSHKLPTLNEKDLKLFTYILKFMSQRSVCQAFLEFQEAIDHLRSSAQDEVERTKLELTHLSGNKIYQDIVEAYRNEVRQPWPLQRCCSHVIWQACRFHTGNVFSLEIPAALRNIITHFH